MTVSKAWGVPTVALCALLATPHAAPSAPAGEVRCFKIKVVDDKTGRGVPLVELRTVNQVRYHTDNNGIVAFFEPGLMNRKVFFHVKSHGYEFPKDGFGFAGASLETKEGGSAELRIRRLNIAERLYRITGAGLYRDTILVGEKPPGREPLLNAQVAGQDSVMAVPYRGRLYWFWGDTARPRYPLGQFQTSGATSELPGKGGLDPNTGIDLTYFVDAEGFSRKMCPIHADGLVWIDGLLTVLDESGRERMIARYARMRSLEKMLEHGLAVFDDQTETFRKLRELDLKEQWRCPRGHPFRAKENSTEYFLFAAPFPNVRVKAEWRSLTDPNAYEAFTPLVGGTRYDKGASKVHRDPNGSCVYAWKPNTDPVSPAQEGELIAAGKIRPEEAWYQPVDIDGGKAVHFHGGSVNWNEYRKKWIAIAVQVWGSPSFLGEVWYAEADAPAGPWRRAKKIVTHEKYSFYNPAHHPFFDQEGGKIIYFEGTYASTFSGNEDPTPRYDYNQIMYRLDLSDPRLRKP